MLDRLGRCLVAWLAAVSLLVSSTAAIVHTHEHTGHAECSAPSKGTKHSHAGCKHHHHAKPVAHSDEPTSPLFPHSHDDCSLCHFLAEHPLPPSLIELPPLIAVAEQISEAPPARVDSRRLELPLARGPPAVA